jgi:hypothetical protein
MSIGHRTSGRNRWEIQLSAVRPGTCHKLCRLRARKQAVPFAVPTFEAGQATKRRDAWGAAR